MRQFFYNIKKIHFLQIPDSLKVCGLKRLTGQIAINWIFFFYYTGKFTLLLFIIYEQRYCQTYTSLCTLVKNRDIISKRSHNLNFITGVNWLVLPPSQTPSFSRYNAGVNFSDFFNSLYSTGSMESYVNVFLSAPAGIS